MKIKRKLGYCGSGSVSDALHDLRRWINANGGMCEIVNATRKTDEKNEEWATCGILCGIMI
jgi:GH24 family phage-related lysozyme (muramidase)